MYIENKKVKDPINSTLNDLKLFEQNSYCYKYLKENFAEESEENLVNNSEIASACFRQANEYYKAALTLSINTSPLLYSYAMNNLLKGVCYLKSFDSEILDGFNSHGFKVERNKLSDDALNLKTTFMKRKGAIHSLLKLYKNELEPQDICLYKLLRHVPDLDNFYYESVGSISLIPKRIKEDGIDFSFDGTNINKETENIFKKFGMMVYPLPDSGICAGYITMRIQQFFNEKRFEKSNVFYKNYLNIAEEFNEGLKAINVAFYCYLLIMTYGMMVRYNANIWEKYVDKKNSQYSTLIELSIINAVTNFYFQMHNLLFSFYYEDDNYTELDIKGIINKSTPDIMNNITKKIISDNRVYNNHYPLPWKENIR